MVNEHWDKMTALEYLQFGRKGQNCNIIFGFNGSGKTTISNAVSFFANANKLKCDII